MTKKRHGKDSETLLRDMKSQLEQWGHLPLYVFPVTPLILTKEQLTGESLFACDAKVVSHPARPQPSERPKFAEVLLIGYNYLPRISAAHIAIA